MVLLVWSGMGTHECREGSYERLRLASPVVACGRAGSIREKARTVEFVRRGSVQQHARLVTQHHRELYTPLFPNHHIKPGGSGPT